jgi:hypothetical protein
LRTLQCDDEGQRDAPAPGGCSGRVVLVRTGRRQFVVGAWFPPHRAENRVAEVCATMWLQGTLRALTGGTVTETRAKKHHALWNKELTGEP